MIMEQEIEFDGNVEWFAYMQYRIRLAYYEVNQEDDDFFFEESFCEWENLVKRLLSRFGIEDCERDFLMDGKFLWDGWHEYSLEGLTYFLKEEIKAWEEND